MYVSCFLFRTCIVKRFESDVLVMVNLWIAFIVLTILLGYFPGLNVCCGGECPLFCRCGNNLDVCFCLLL